MVESDGSGVKMQRDASIVRVPPLRARILHVVPLKSCTLVNVMVCVYSGMVLLVGRFIW